jgi:peptidoglycan biosynthesis protein MviN/MurJ (putative lipid II flippase)
MATVIASGANCLCLGIILHRRIGPIGWRRLTQGLLKMLLAALAMAWVTMRVPAWVHRLTGATAVDGKLTQLLGVLAAILAGLAVYGALVVVLRIPRSVREPTG